MVLYSVCTVLLLCSLVGGCRLFSWVYFVDLYIDFYSVVIIIFKIFRIAHEIQQRRREVDHQIPSVPINNALINWKDIHDILINRKVLQSVKFIHTKEVQRDHQGRHQFQKACRKETTNAVNIFQVLYQGPEVVLTGADPVSDKPQDAPSMGHQIS